MDDKPIRSTTCNEATNRDNSLTPEIKSPFYNVPTSWQAIIDQSWPHAALFGTVQWLYGNKYPNKKIMNEVIRFQRANYVPVAVAEDGTIVVWEPHSSYEEGPNVTPSRYGPL